MFVLNLRSFHQHKRKAKGIALLNFNRIIVNKKGFFSERRFAATLVENNDNRFGIFSLQFVVVVMSARIRGSRSCLT